MNNKTTSVGLFKNSPIESLKSAEANYSLFSEDVLAFTKKVDRPNEYYTEGDLITFEITIKNNGDKKISNFILKDELESHVKPFDGVYDVYTSNGEIKSYSNPIIIDKISLEPSQIMIVKITGAVSYKS